MTPVAANEVLGARYSQLVRAGAAAASVANWDATLPRPPRVLVPTDVQALVVAAGDEEPVAQVLSPLPDPAPSGAGSTPSFPPVAPFTDGAGRRPASTSIGRHPTA